MTDHRFAASHLVLIVDDDAAIRGLLSDLLIEEGYEVVEAVNGADAIARAFELTPDAVLMDLMMPVVSGAEATATLKRDPRTAHVPILAMSGGRTLHVLSQTVAADAFIPKPFDIDDVLASVARFVPAP